MKSFPLNQPKGKFDNNGIGPTICQPLGQLRVNLRSQQRVDINAE